MFKEKRIYKVVGLDRRGVRKFETCDMPFLKYVKEIREEGITGVYVISHTGYMVKIPAIKCKCFLCSHQRDSNL